MDHKETEEEMKARLKAEILAELKNEMSNEVKEEKVEKKENYNKPEEHHKVQFNSYSDKALEELNEMNRKDRKLNYKDDEIKNVHLPQAEEGANGSSYVVLFVLSITVVLAVFFFPKVYKFVEEQFKKEEPPKVSNTNSNVPKEPVLETITKDSKVLEKFKYPIMRNNPYSKTSYYTRDVFPISDMSNNDLLYNALIYVYKGNFAKYEGGYATKYCGSNDLRKQLNAKYIDARIDNMFTKSVSYKRQDFVVPSTNPDTPYVGQWKYDSRRQVYVYYGDCNPIGQGNIEYIDLLSMYDAKGLEKNTKIEVYYYIGFAAVNKSNKSYKIYSDANMTTVITEGILTTNDAKSELNQIFNNSISSGMVNSKYKYTFSTQDCSYQDYCFIQGEWLK